MGRSQKDALELVVEAAVCMANGGGGTVVFGVNDRAMGRAGAIPVAIARLLDHVMANNPITTVEHGPFHFEYRTYPEIALREAIMNAF
jgi:predicted HTH transcriptional regulator